MPTVRDADPLRARWAALRVRELDVAAHALEARDPARARALWQHASCLAPADVDLARRARAIIPAVTLHRPSIERGEQMPDALDAWSSLAAPIAVATRAPAPASTPTRQAVARTAPAPANSAAMGLVDETAAHVRAARFEAALASADRARREGASLAPRTRAALEIWAATAALALGREDDAKASLGRALDAEPNLRLDSATSPKVRRALDAVRAERKQ
ncbi:MAG TPA: hypothetical protein VFY49_10560 [Myxococcota bacterium]|nr:hypothetical protein [Myxococcota bacterium]